MKTTFTRLFTVLMLMMVSMGAQADVKVLFGDKGTEKFEGSGGSIKIEQADSKDDKAKVKVYLTFIPNSGYTFDEKSLQVYAVVSPDAAYTRAPEISGDPLKLTEEKTDISSAKRYSVDIDSKLALWVKSATFLNGRKDDDDSGQGYSGTYYIGSVGYNPDNTANNYYLCPTEGWCYYQATDDFTGTDNGKPFLTTYKCRDGKYDATKAVWVIEKASASNSDYYYIKQKKTGKYLVANGVIRTTSGGQDRMRVHLEEIANLNEAGNKVLFSISPYNTYLVISPKEIVDGDNYTSHSDHDNHKWLTVNAGNKNFLTGQSGKGNGPQGYSNTAGIIGIWTQGDSNAPFYLEDVPIPTPTFTVSADGTVKISCSEEGTVIHYTLDGSEPTKASTVYSSALSSADVLAASSVKAIAVRTIGSQKSVVATLPVITYNYHIVNLAKNIAVTSTEKHPVGYPLTSGYDNIPTAIRSSYLSDETIGFYTMDGDFNAANLDDEHSITATLESNANIYITYTAENLWKKFLPLTNASPYNIKDGNKCRYDDNGVLKTDATDSEYKAGAEERQYLWYFIGSDPYDVKIQNVNTSTHYINYASPNLSIGGAQSFILKETAYHTNLTKTAYEDITFRNASGEEVSLRVNTVVLPISYTLIDKQNKIIKSAIEYEGSFGLPSAWQSPLATYKYYKAATQDGDTYSCSEEDRIYSIDQLGGNTVIYVTYDVKDDIDLDGRNLLGVENKTGKTYRLQFAGGENFYQEDGSDGVMTAARKAVYPYSNGDASLYVYGNERWENQLASGASTRTRWLWYIEPAHDVLDPYHVKISSYQTQTSYKNPDTGKTTNFHSYLKTYKPEGHNAIVTGATNDNPAVTGGSESAAANNSDATEYMLLGTSLTSLKLVTVEPISDGTTNERRTVNSFEQYWKNNPTVQGKLSAKVTQVGRNVTLTADQKSQLPTGWHTYDAWANSAPWVHNNDGGGGKAHTTSKKFLEEEHVFQTISMGETFQFIETEIKPMLILLDQHGWEIVRLPLPSGPSDPKRKDVYADIHKYSSPMVARYHFWKTGTKIPGYHKYKVSDYATVSATDDTEYTADELGRANINDPLTPPNLPNYETQALVGGKERDWYVTYDVKSEYANTYAGAATKEETSAAPFLVKQGGKYAQINGTSIDKVDAPASIENVPESMQWYLRPNFDIDEEMGYIYAGETGAQEEAKSKDETEADYFDHTREDAVSTWSNGFDPYNVQIQSMSNTARYFTANTTGSAVTSSWTGTGTSGSISLQNMGKKQNNVKGLDQVDMNITNATFMVVDDGNGNMRLMPRFDNTKVMQNFTTLATQADAAAKDDEGTGNQTLYLTMVPKVVSSSSEINAMGGHYLLASNFTASESIGTREAPFKGIIEGQIGQSFNVSAPFIAYAEDAIIKNVIIESANSSSENADGHYGAIVATAKGNTRIYNCGVNGGSISGTNHVGGIVGHLVDNARVINCYSFANITGGTDVGGIVGYNGYVSNANDIRTMVMNCMFYGDITGGDKVSPVYGGLNIDNRQDKSSLNTFNYYAYDELKSKAITDYNCALAVEEKYLNRFEFYRLLLNSNKKLAAYYASTNDNTVSPNDMAKWVLETADRTIDNPKPYPVLKDQGYYPSIINYDTRDLDNYTEENRNQGLKTGTLAVTISGVGSNAPSGATITNGSLSLTRTDKDFNHFNFNYDKVQLPYYNDVGTGNYTGYRVVTSTKTSTLSLAAYFRRVPISMFPTA